MRYYVYILFDPETKSAFYVGIGANASTKDTKGRLAYEIGATGEIILQDLSRFNDKARKRIEELTQHPNINKNDIARVIVKYLSEQEARNVASFLATSYFDRKKLLTDEFYDDSQCFIPRDQLLDLRKGIKDGFNYNSIAGQQGVYYTYALFDPESGKPFYIGKGVNDRVMDHFREAERYPQRVTDKLTTIRLLSNKYSPEELIRILAINGIGRSRESDAFNIEALCIAYIYGYTSVSNDHAGNNIWKFRSRDDWEKRLGFDIPNLTYRGRPSYREKEDTALGRGLDNLLMSVAESLDIPFQGEPKFAGAGELAIHAHVGQLENPSGLQLKISARQVNIFCELWCNAQTDRRWLEQRMSGFGGAHLLRGDGHMNPYVWQTNNEAETSDVDTAIQRAQILLELVRTESYEDLSESAKGFLNSGREIRSNPVCEARAIDNHRGGQVHEIYTTLCTSNDRKLRVEIFFRKNSTISGRLRCAEASGFMDRLSQEQERREGNNMGRYRFPEDGFLPEKWVSSGQNAKVFHRGKDRPRLLKLVQALIDLVEGYDKGQGVCIEAFERAMNSASD